jgi:hypothetical protein
MSFNGCAFYLLSGSHPENAWLDPIPYRDFNFSVNWPENVGKWYG